MQKRANLAIVLGIILALVGGASVLLILNNDRRDSKKPSATATATTEAGTVPVLVATGQSKAGALGSDVLAQNLATVQSVALANRQSGALASAADLAGRKFATDVPAGSQILGSALSVAGVVGGNPLPTPQDKQALALSIDFVGGVAGYPIKGGFVNVYGLIQPKTQSVLLLSHVQVLDISSEPLTSTNNNTTATTTPARVAQQSLVYLLAVSPEEAGQLIVFSRFDSLYMTLQPNGQGAVPTGKTFSGA